MAFQFLGGGSSQRAKWLALISGCALLVACTNAPDATPTRTARTRPTPITGQSVLADRQARVGGEAIPALAAREENFKKALASPLPVLPLANVSDVLAKQAQDLALQNPQFLSYTRHPQTKQPLRSEIFQSRPARPSDLGPADAVACQDKKCYRVEMYNYSYNLASFAVVNVNDKKVVSVNHHPGTQPDIPLYLTSSLV